MSQALQRLRPAIQELLFKPVSSRYVGSLAEVSTAEPQNPRIHVMSDNKPRFVTEPSLFSSLYSSFQNSNKNILKNAEKDAVGTNVVKYYYRKCKKKNQDGLASLYGVWELKLWSRARLEYESNLKVSQAWKLLYGKPIYRNIQLWGYLLDYRYHAHGLAGVKMFWEVVFSKGLTLPVCGQLANKIWSTLLKLGFKDPVILQQIVEYAEKIFQCHGKRWLPLYDSILEYILIHQNGKDALKWHERLYPHHPPGAARFRAFFREVLHQRGNDSVLKDIYKRCPYRNVYSCVVPLYCRCGQFQKAMHWHFFLLEFNDYPSQPKNFEPLIRHLAIYNKSKSPLVIQSLLDAGISVDPEFTFYNKNHIKISGELMNIIHGKTFGISVKKYNDELGARWFATSWISLDTAISTILALGVRQIGPLSLQAIALRDPTADSVIERINQLRGNGISIGDYLFSKALEHFAVSRNIEFMQGLLHNEQRPDQLDNYQLQLKLLFMYARARDWAKFNQLLEIQSLTSRNPVVYKKNMQLQVLLMDENISGAQQLFEEMKSQGIPIKSSTVSHILARKLQPRRPGGYPCNRTKNLFESIKILYDIIRSGSYVPAYHWREIIRRLGMLGRLDELESLSLNLVGLYLPRKGNVALCNWKFPDVPANNPFHPARKIFDSNFQRAVVAWGFIHPLSTAFQGGSLANDPDGRSCAVSKLPDITFGINLLKKLNKLGVPIDGNIVGRAILDRLITYFGPAISHKKYNNVGRILMRGRLMEVAEQIDNALGGTFLLAIDLPKYLQDMIQRRSCKIDRHIKKLLLKKEMRKPRRFRP